MQSTQTKEKLRAVKRARTVSDVSAYSCCVDFEGTNVPSEAERLT